MTTPHFPVPPRQSARSGSKENIGQFGGDGITMSDKHTDRKIPYKGVEAVHPVPFSARQRLPTQHYPVPGPLSPRHTTTNPYVEQAPRPGVKQTTEQAAKSMRETPSQAAPPRVDIVSAAQPAQRTRTGFQPNSQYPSSYIGMPASTTGITIGRPEEMK